jgi:predicted transcriptional regulator of viral defense system
VNVLKLNQIQQLYFSTADIARFLNISLESARVTASRYVKKNVLVRLKRDLYLTSSRIAALTESERFRIANIIQTPSYVSLTTALSYHGLSTQQQQNFVESVALKRTKSVLVHPLTFSYSLVKEDFYDGFELRDDFFIAISEKALADAVYLTSLGRYTCDFYAIDFRRINKTKVFGFIKRTNRTTELFWEKLCENFKI